MLNGYLVQQRKPTLQAPSLPPMAFTTMHFAVGMVGGGAIASVGALYLRRGWRWIPMAMTLGGIWACVPDFPRIFKEDFPNLPLAQTLSAKPLQQWLNANGDWFFLHRMLDSQPKEFALHGLLGILMLYTTSVFVLGMTHRRPAKTLEKQADPATVNASDPSDTSRQQAA